MKDRLAHRGTQPEYGSIVSAKESKIPNPTAEAGVLGELKLLQDDGLNNPTRLRANAQGRAPTEPQCADHGNLKSAGCRSGYCGSRPTDIGLSRRLLQPHLQACPLPAPSRDRFAADIGDADSGRDVPLEQTQGFRCAGQLAGPFAFGGGGSDGPSKRSAASRPRRRHTHLDERRGRAWGSKVDSCRRSLVAFHASRQPTLGEEFLICRPSQSLDTCLSYIHV